MPVFIFINTATALQDEIYSMNGWILHISVMYRVTTTMGNSIISVGQRLFL